jgi:excisionase family DNA binding protein
MAGMTLTKASKRTGQAKNLPTLNHSAGPAPDLLNYAGAAELLQQQPRTIRLWARTRGLPHYKPTAKVVLFRRAEILAWLERSRVVLAA